MKYFLLIVFLMSNWVGVTSQTIIDETKEANASIYNEFNAFFEAEIKRQGVKGNWIFRMNEITGFHRFDYNHDGFNDVLIEFNAISVEGEAVINYYAVLLQNNKNKVFKYLNFVDTNDLLFDKFENSFFVFNHISQSNLVSFRLEKSNFVKIK